MAEHRIARIIATESYLPSKRLTNKDLEQMVDTTEEWIVTRTGMRERRLAAENEFASDMGLKAAKKALESAGLSPDDIDLVAVATSTPDYIFPSTASLIQGALGCSRAAAFDFQAACSGYIYGLSLAKGLVEAGVHGTVLLIASEKLSTLVDYTDRATCILFGDGAAASIISSKGAGLVIEHVQLGSDGNQHMITSVPGGGCRQPACRESVDAKQHYIQMKGRELFKHAVRRMEQAMQQSLEHMKLEKEQISWLIPHQANLRIIQAVAKRFEVDPAQVYLTVGDYGNTSASSIPIALARLLKDHQIEAGQYLMMPAFGAGLAWGNAVLKKVEH